jgi:Tol biopolymer transport system component
MPIFVRQTSSRRLRVAPLWFGILTATLLASCVEHRPMASTSDEHQVASVMGTARSPVSSRDGAAIAFAAVGAGYVNPQIWIARADGSGPSRPLTSDTFENYDPEFSPDGASIYFTSSREPHGVYRIPSTGGQPQLVVAGGYAARFSPDGKTLVIGSAGKLVVHPQPDGAPFELLPDVANSYAPVWSPDGTSMLVTVTNPATRQPDWWIAPLSRGESVHTSLADALQRQGFNLVAPNAWLEGGWVVFTGRIGETQTLWKVQLRPDGTVADRAVRATSSEAGDSGASFTAGRLVFARTDVGMNFWALPFDSSGEHVTAPPVPLTTGTARKGQHSVAGQKLLYSAEDGNRFSIFVQDAARRTKVRDGLFYSLVAPDGSAYVYGEGTKEDLKVSMKSFAWWRFWSTSLCEHCGMPRAFTPDGHKLLLWNDTSGASHFDLLDLSSGQVITVVVAGGPLSSPRLSPDGRWVSFVAKVDNGWQGFVAPLRDDRPSLSGDWVPVTAPSDAFFYALWSARNDLIYILSSRHQGGNLRFLDAQRVDPTTKQREGEPVAVYEFEESLVPGMDAIWNPITIDQNRLVIELGGVSSSVWIK